MFRFCLCLAFFIPSVCASVKVGSGALPLDHRAAHALAGALTFEVNGDDFYEASAAQPVFIRISLTQGVTLSRTRVLQSDADPVLQQPINLAMRVDTRESATVAAVPDAVRIVRWVAGESAVWLEVRQSSDQWLSLGGNPVWPSTERVVRFSLGVSAQTGDALFDASAGEANLPFNTRGTAVEGAPADAVSTVLCVDTTASSLTDDGTRPGLLVADLIALVGADQGNGSYGGGIDTGINFTPLPLLGRGVSRDHTVSTPVLGDLGTAQQGDLVALSQEVALALQAIEGGMPALQELHPGAAFTFSTSCPEVGFPLADGAAFNGLPGTVTADIDSAVVVAGETLYREVTLVYTGPPLAAKPLPIDLVLLPWYGPEAAASCTLDVVVTLPNHGGAADVAPYDGPDQACRCDVVTATPAAFTIPLVLPAPVAATVRR